MIAEIDGRTRLTKNEQGNVLRERLTDVDRKIELDGIECIPQVVDTLIDWSNTAFNVLKNKDLGLTVTRKAKTLISDYMQTTLGMSIRDIDQYCRENSTSLKELDMWWELLLNESPYWFESYIDYMEKDREFEKKFYAPRKKTLGIVVNDMQILDDSPTQKFYGLSMPSRVGKSTICIFFLTWVAMKKPNSHTAMGGHSGTLVKGFYKELLNFIVSEEYQYAKLFGHCNPNRMLLRDKSAEDFTITLDRPDRFATLTCRGIDATWTGAVDVSKDGYLYVDDLVRDRQHSLSPTRMEETYQEYLNKMVDRKNDGAKELMVGTLWNVLDPLERIRQQFEDDDRYVFRRIPALDDNDHSNFDYEVNGFSSQYYIEMRERLDQAEWQSKFQQHPFVREGLLFPTDEMIYFNGLIEDDTRRVVAVCDPAFGGGDSLSMPICLETVHNKKYIIDWVYNKGTQKVTVPRIVDKIIEHHITSLRIEKNNGGALLAENVKKELKERNVIFCKVETKSAPNGMPKEEKIKAYSDYVKDNFIFLVPKKSMEEVELDVAVYKRSDEYQKAIEEMCMYTAEGKNPHDDSADSVTQLAMFYEDGMNGTVSVVKNPFGGGY